MYLVYSSVIYFKIYIWCYKLYFSGLYSISCSQYSLPNVLYSIYSMSGDLNIINIVKIFQVFCTQSAVSYIHGSCTRYSVSYLRCSVLNILYHISGVLCLICCTISMGFAHGAGNYVFILFDNFSGNFPLLIIAFFECIAVSYVYGLKR